MKTKINTLLALCEGAAKVINESVSRISALFAKSFLFIGAKKTYEPVSEEFEVDESKVEDSKPKEKVIDILNDFAKELKVYFTRVLSVEKSNSTSRTIDLIVEGKNFGKFTIYELLRLKSKLQENWYGIFRQIPELDNSKNWSVYDNGMYFTATKSYAQRTTTKKSEILPDPNLVGKELPAAYQSNVIEKPITIVIGNGTITDISSAVESEFKSMLVKRKELLIEAINAAMQEFNSSEMIDTEVNVDSVTNYICGID